jgi:hypothetical protein
LDVSVRVRQGGRAQIAIAAEVDYAMLQKLYAGGQVGRYSPAECIGTKKVEVTGSPHPKHVSTSHVEDRTR